MVRRLNNSSLAQNMRETNENIYKKLVEERERRNCLFAKHLKCQVSTNTRRRRQFHSGWEKSNERRGVVTWCCWNWDEKMLRMRRVYRSLLCVVYVVFRSNLFLTCLDDGKIAVFFLPVISRWTLSRRSSFHGKINIWNCQIYNFSVI